VLCGLSQYSSKYQHKTDTGVFNKFYGTIFHSYLYVVLYNFYNLRHIDNFSELTFLLSLILKCHDYLSASTRLIEHQTKTYSQVIRYAFFLLMLNLYSMSSIIYWYLNQMLFTLPTVVPYTVQETF